ncbi:MAG TPA: hypothetical protein H9881_09780 [Candidatus Stackebrandtia excrementipullorum]|nr:hypothetical protein [Candidatus Stackebrandtia excrementipullorum]
MANYHLFRRTVRAAVLGRHHDVKIFLREIKDDEVDQFNNFLSAAFYGAVILEFAYDREDDAIDKFSQQMVEAHPDLDPPMETRVVEHNVRGMLGEHHLLDGLEKIELYRTQLLTIRFVAARHPVMREKVNEYTEEAQHLAQQWENGETPNPDFGWFEEYEDA